MGEIYVDISLKIHGPVNVTDFNNEKKVMVIILKEEKFGEI